MNVILLVAAVAGWLWGAVLLQRLAPLYWCLLFLLVASCFGNDFLNFQIGPLPLTLDRIAFLAALAAYVLQRRQDANSPRPLTHADRCGAALLVWFAVSTALGIQREPTGILGETQYRLLAGYLMPAAVFWIARQSKLNSRQVSGVHGALALFGLYLALTGIFEVLRMWPLVFPRYIADPAKGLHFGRARGPFVHSVSLGLYLGICGLAAWAWLPTLRRGTQLAVILALPLFLSAVFLTYTRSVWLGVALSVLTVLVLALRGAWRPLVFGVAVAGGLVVGLTQMDSILYMKREHSAAEAAGSVDMRSTFAYVSWQMFQDRPLAGVGFGQFPQAKLPYLDDRTTELRLEVIRPFVHHNTFLSVLTETGAIGLALFLGLLTLCGRDAWRLWSTVEAPYWARRHGLLLLGSMGVYALQLLFHELTYNTVHNSLFCLLAGMTVGLRQMYAPVSASVPLAQQALSGLLAMRNAAPKWPAQA